MARKLTPREIRTVQIGAVILVAIPAFTFGTKWIDDWRQVRLSLSQSQEKLKDLEADAAKQAGLLSLVPVFEPPEEEDVQKFLFRDKLHDQLKKAGINTEPLQFLPVRKVEAWKVLKIQCKGKCKFNQLLDLLASLKENPYLVGIEELKIDCDTKQPPDKRQDVEVSLTVSTFVK
jgi:hypothetical protein